MASQRGRLGEESWFVPSGGPHLAERNQRLNTGQGVASVG